MKRKFILLCSFFLMTQVLHAQWQRTLFGIFVKGVVSGFGEELGSDLYESSFGMRTNNVYAMYPELAARLESIETNVGQLESQVYEINNRLGILDLRVEKLEGDSPHGSFGLGYGLGDYQNNSYSTMNSLATINFFGEASVGLNLNIHTFDVPENIELERETANFTNILSYARFGSEEGNAHVMFGQVSTSGFGNNFLFRNYSNDIIYNDRQIGFKSGIKSPLIGVEVMASGFSNDRLKAGRVFLRPFSFIDSEVPLVLSNFGYNYITDVDANGREINVQAFDAQFPIVMKVEDEETHTFVNLFGNYATFNDYGKGYGVGASLEYKYIVEGLGCMGFGGWYEYRKLDKNFITGYFNPFYELGRYNNSYSSFSLIEQITDETIEQSIGFEVQVSYLGLSGYYVSDASEDPQNRNNYLHLQAMVGIPIPLGEKYMNIFGTASIDKRNIDKFEVDFSELMDNDSFDSIFSLSGGVNIPISETGVDLFGKYIYRDFFYLNLDNSFDKIKNSFFLFGMQYNWGDGD